MTRTNQLNSLVESYRQGNEEALDDIFRKVNPLIERASNELDRTLKDVTTFECRTILKIKRLLKTYDTKSGSFFKVVKTIISRERSDFFSGRGTTVDDASLDYMTSEEVGAQFEDPEASVINEVELKEKIALLAQDDSRKTVILTQWSRGANDKSISELLAQRFGGQSESHRKFITRFKTECRRKLETAMSTTV